MTDNIINFPTAYEPEPDEPQEQVIRIVIETPEAPPQPAITGVGLILAVMCGVNSLLVMSTLVG